MAATYRDTPRCFAYNHERRVYCALPPDHSAPHGWDYGAGKAAVIKPSEWGADLRAHGLGQLADRLAFIHEES